MYRIRQRTRDPLPVAVYASAEWRRLAAAVVAEATRCAYCHRPRGEVVLSADHVRSIRERPDLALEPSNVVPCCRSCQEYRKRDATWGLR